VSNWDALAKASNGIVGLKAWESGTDKQITKENLANFEKNLQQAEARQMIIIGYAFGVGDVSGAAQADALLALFNMGTPGHPAPGHIVALDFEHNPDGPTMTEAEATDFINRVYEQTGRYPILYASEDYTSRPGVLGKCPRWVAAYGPLPSNTAIWQYTDGVLGPGPHSFPGVGSCDINKLLVTYGALRTMVGL
jgi:lysozyme